MVKRLRHRPFTAVTGVQIPLESLHESAYPFGHPACQMLRMGALRQVARDKVSDGAVAKW